MNDYNLLDEEWIPVLYHNGTVQRVGILKALEDADRIRQIAASNPMDRVAILRFLLAILYWCKGNPGSLPDGSFPAQCVPRLNDNRSCFNLLGDGKRFYQDRAAERLRAITDLIQEIPTGNNFWHFRHSTDKRDGLCRACCAMGLLRLPLFSVSGLSGPGQPNMMAGINGPPPIYVLPWEKSLLETLAANWVNREDLGEPTWVPSNTAESAKEGIPLLTGLTLVSRRVFLHEPSEEPGVCIACGSNGTPVIRTCGFQTCGKQESDLWDDPHVLYSDTKPRKALKAADLTSVWFRMDRPWPDLLARLAAKGGPVSLLVVGFATNKAKNVDVWERTVQLRSSVPGTALSSIMEWQEEGRLLEKRAGRSKKQWTAAIVTIRPHVESRVSADVGSLLEGEDEAWQQAAAEYGPMMNVIAQSLTPGFTTAALTRQNDIANAVPDMRRKGKPTRKEGDK